jgi:hypothetical protein
VCLLDLLLLLGQSLGAETLEGEVDEQVKVRSIHQSTSNEVRLVVRARSARKHVVPCRHAHTGADKHLNDLRRGDDESGERLGQALKRLQAVVSIHDGVHSVVHGDEVKARAGERAVGVPAEEENGHVVVPVEEDQGLLAENDEERVDELGDLDYW